MHWTAFVLVLLAHVFIDVFELFPKGSFLRTDIKAAHFTTRIAVLLLVLPRGRLRSGRPPIVPARSCAMDWFSRLTHFALHAFLLVRPVPGIAGRWTRVTCLMDLAAVVVDTPDATPSHQQECIHGTIGTIFHYATGLHIAAVLWHHGSRRDNTLTHIL